VSSKGAVNGGDGLGRSCMALSISFIEHNN
jgi:hypothetical protein